MTITRRLRRFRAGLGPRFEFLFRVVGVPEQCSFNRVYEDTTADRGDVRTRIPNDPLVDLIAATICLRIEASVSRERLRTLGLNQALTPPCSQLGIHRRSRKTFFFGNREKGARGCC